MSGASHGTEAGPATSRIVPSADIVHRMSYVWGRLPEESKMTPEQLLERSPIDGIRLRDIPMVRQLMQANLDLAKPRDIGFVLVVADEESASAAASQVEALGLEVKVTQARDEWSVVGLSHGRAVVPDFARETIDRCDEIATSHGGRFDGWFAAETAEEVSARRPRGFFRRR